MVFIDGALPAYLRPVLYTAGLFASAIYTTGLVLACRLHLRLICSLLLTPPGYFRLEFVPPTYLRYVVHTVGFFLPGVYTAGSFAACC